MDILLFPVKNSGMKPLIIHPAHYEILVFIYFGGVIWFYLVKVGGDVLAEVV